MHLTIVSATTHEINPLLLHLKHEWRFLNMMSFVKRELSIHPLVAGVGSMSMAFSLARFQQLQKSDLIMHVGISGCYDFHAEIGELCEVRSERWGDLGAEDHDGRFLSTHELNLSDPDRFPFEKGIITTHKEVPPTQLKSLDGMTVNCCSGTEHTIEVRRRMNAPIESMEGIGVFYACRIMDIPFLSVRGISNHVTPRNKAMWNIDLAIRKLNAFTIDYIESLC